MQIGQMARCMIRSSELGHTRHARKRCLALQIGEGGRLCSLDSPPCIVQTMQGFCLPSLMSSRLPIRWPCGTSQKHVDNMSSDCLESYNVEGQFELKINARCQSSKADCGSNSCRQVPKRHERAGRGCEGDHWHAFLILHLAAAAAAAFVLQRKPKPSSGLVSSLCTRKGRGHA